MPPKISVILLNWNGKRFLKPCIDSLLKQSYQDFEIVLADNGSTDGSREYVKKSYARLFTKKKIVIINTGGNIGFTGGNNIGVKKSRGELIVLLNNDTRPKRHWLKELLKGFNTPMPDGRPVMLAGSQSLPKGQVKAILRYLKKRLGLMLNFSGYNILRKTTQYERETCVYEQFFAGGAAVMFRKKEFPQPFDKDYFIYAEDVYLGWRAQLLGGAVVHVTKSQFYHDAGSTKKSGDRSINEFLVFNATKNEVMNLLIFYQRLNIVRVAPLFLVTQLAQMIENPRRIRLKMKSYWWVLTHFNSIMKKRERMQRTRKVPDKDIIRRMSCRFFEPISRYVRQDAQKKWIRIMNRIFYAYCAIVGLRTAEFR